MLHKENFCKWLCGTQYEVGNLILDYPVLNDRLAEFIKNN